MYTLFRWTAVFAILGVLSAASYWLAVSQTSAEALERLEAELSPAGSTLDGLQGGDGDWRLLDTFDERISVEVEDVNLALGTVLDVTACGISIGTITLVDVDPDLLVIVPGGDLNLDERDGQAVPTCDVGDTVTVKNGATTILEDDFEPKD